MTIKIDAHREAAETEATISRRVTPSRVPGGATAATPSGASDRVEVSTDAQLMSSALKAAGDVSAIRQDVVERARKALEAGQIGRDSGALADRLIDDLLDG